MDMPNDNPTKYYGNPETIADEHDMKWDKGSEKMEGSNLDALIAGFMASNGRNDRYGYGYGCGYELLPYLLCNNGFGRGYGCGGDYGGYGYGHKDDVLMRHISDEANATRILDRLTQHGLRIEEAECDLSKDIMRIDAHLADRLNDVQAKTAECCCDTNRHIDQVDRHLSEGICDLKTGLLKTDFLIEKNTNEVLRAMDKGFCDQTALIKDKFCEQTAFITAEFRAIEMRDKDKEIDKLKFELAQKNLAISQNKQTQEIISAINTVCGD